RNRRRRKWRGRRGDDARRRARSRCRHGDVRRTPRIAADSRRAARVVRRARRRACARPDGRTEMTETRDKLALALDVPDPEQAEQLAKEVGQWFGVAKVGLELFSAAGPEAISRLRALDLRVFVDLKLHD